MKWRRGDVLAALVALLAAAACVRLGIWQLDRLAQRRAHNAALAARVALPPVALPAPALSGEAAHQRRATARGVFDFAREQVWPGRSFEGTPGVALITPLRLADGSAVLVDRGWVPSPDAFHVDRARYREPDSAAVRGLALVPPRGRGDVDPRALRGVLPYPLHPFVIQAEQPPSPGLPRRWPPPAFRSGPHLFYAIQWFSFAAIIVVGTVLLLRKHARA